MLARLTAAIRDALLPRPTPEQLVARCEDHLRALGFDATLPPVDDPSWGRLADGISRAGLSTEDAVAALYAVAPIMPPI